MKTIFEINLDIKNSISDIENSIDEIQSLQEKNDAIEYAILMLNELKNNINE